MVKSNESVKLHKERLTAYTIVRPTVVRIAPPVYGLAIPYRVEWRRGGGEGSPKHSSLSGGTRCAAIGGVRVQLEIWDMASRNCAMSWIRIHYAYLHTRASM